MLNIPQKNFYFTIVNEIKGATILCSNCKKPISTNILIQEVKLITEEAYKVEFFHLVFIEKNKKLKMQIIENLIFSYNNVECSRCYLIIGKFIVSSNFDISDIYLLDKSLTFLSFTSVVQSHKDFQTYKCILNSVLSKFNEEYFINSFFDKVEFQKRFLGLNSYLNSFGSSLNSKIQISISFKKLILEVNLSKKQLRQSIKEKKELLIEKLLKDKTTSWSQLKNEVIKKPELNDKFF